MFYTMVAIPFISLKIKTAILGDVAGLLYGYN